MATVAAFRSHAAATQQCFTDALSKLDAADQGSVGQPQLTKVMQALFPGWSEAEVAALVASSGALTGNGNVDFRAFSAFIFEPTEDVEEAEAERLRGELEKTRAEKEALASEVEQLKSTTRMPALSPTNWPADKPLVRPILPPQSPQASDRLLVQPMLPPQSPQAPGRPEPLPGPRAARGGVHERPLDVPEPAKLPARPARADETRPPSSPEVPKRAALPREQRAERSWPEAATRRPEQAWLEQPATSKSPERITASQFSLALRNMAAAWEAVPEEQRLPEDSEVSFFDDPEMMKNLRNMVRRWHTGESSHPDKESLAGCYDDSEAGLQQLLTDLQLLRSDPRVEAADRELRITKYTAPPSQPSVRSSGRPGESIDRAFAALLKDFDSGPPTPYMQLTPWQGD